VVLHPAAVGDDDVGDALLDNVELLGGVALGDQGRAGRKAAAWKLVQRQLEPLRRDAVEDRATGLWTRYGCVMRFERCQASIVLPRHLEFGSGQPYASRVAMTGASDRELEPGDTLGPYLLESVLGEGGMGLVFKAHREGDERPVALKVLKRQLSGDLVFQHRFQHEARAAAEVRDRHLVAILESAEWDGRHCIASDYVDGGSLTERVASSGPLPLADVVRVVTEIGTGLDALHAAGVVHRDIKPSNVLFDSDGTAKLTDFGLAKGRAYTVLTRPGQVMGTLDYLAPELIRGQPATPATDLYALGCVSFECVAGRAPFGDKGAFQVGLAHLEEIPPDPCAERPEAPAHFSAAILTALEKDPERRPATAGAYASLLRDAAGEGTPA